MYRAAVEWLLGVRLRGTSLFVEPCIPRTWSGFSITFRYHSARYEVRVENPHGATRGVARVEVDGAPLTPVSAGVPLADDGVTHRVQVWLG